MDRDAGACVCVCVCVCVSACLGSEVGLHVHDDGIEELLTCQPSSQG